MKRVLSMFLIVALLLSVPFAQAEASLEENVTVVGKFCPCGCGKAASEIQWKPWNVNVDGAPADGHYYLEDNYAQSKQFTIMAGDRVVIDLRGKTLTTQNYGRLFLVYGYLAVMDTVGGGRMCSKTSGAAYGGVVMVAMNETADPTFAFHSGTLTVDADNKSSLAGGIVTVGNGCHFIMYGGTMLGGSTTERGGAVRGSANSDIQILGGSVIGGKSTTSGGIIWSNANVTLKNCRISGGEAASSGGNIYQEGGALTVENAVIEHGVANGDTNGGGNIFASGSNCKVNIKNSTIHNGYAATNGGNLYLGKGTQRLENVKISGGVAAGKGANLYQGAEASVTVVGGEIADAAGSECPHCNQIVTWTEAGDTLSGHCYLTGAKNITAAYSITGDVVLDLRGCNITSSERAFKVAAGATLTILDTVGGATVKGSGVEGESGGVVHNSGTLRIYGGNYVYVAGKTVTSGGVIYTTGNTNIYGGLFVGSAFSNTATTALGGVLHMTDGTKTFTMTAGHVLGGNVYAGGTLCFGQQNTVNITGGSFQGGTATNSGANLRFNGASGKVVTATIQNVLISGGTATTAAGTLYLNYCNMDLENSLVMDGKANSYGGNIMLGSRGFLTATDCFITGGTAPKGGNVYASSYVCGANFVDCTLTGGQATGSTGGNLMINQGNITFTGGEISYGKAKTNGGNVYNNGANYNDTNAKDDGFRLYASEKGKPVITGGTAGTNGGNIYISGVTELNSGFIHNGSAATGKDIYYTSNANLYSLTVGTGLTGNISLGVAAANFTGSEVVNATAVEFPGELLLENKDGRSLTVKDGKLVLGSIAVVAADGSTQWVADMAAAQNAYTEGGYIQIFADTTMTLTKDCAVDLNGKTLTVSGVYTVYGMDSSGDDYTEGTGKLILTDGATAAFRTTVADGREYISIVNENTVSLHRLGMRITDVTLRPDACGVYYKATWDCDSTLAAFIESYGVTLSVYRQPGEDFMEDKLCVETKYDGAELVSGEKKTGVLIRNIMKDSLAAEENENRGQLPIYAKAYLQLTDGTKLMSQGADDSLKTAMERLDGLISSDPTMFRRYTNDARAFYETWKENGMNGWDFTNLPTPEKDDVIDILMIGNSFCYYYVEELYGLAEAAGIRMRVCNVYYSGCTLAQHYNWWTKNEAMYQLFVTDGNGRKQYNNVSLEYCLAQGNWDVISLQESSSAIRNSGSVEKHLSSTALYADTLIPYLCKEFPDAEFYWHQTWAYQIGYDRNGYQMTSLEQQDRDMQYQKDYALVLCEKYGVGRINTGKAWQIVREGGYDNLCARLGVGTNNAGDYYHDGDIGGGQYLNACVWFEVITGISCVGNTYAPVYTYGGQTYTLDADFITTLQNAAHQAVENLKTE